MNAAEAIAEEFVVRGCSGLNRLKCALYIRSVGGGARQSDPLPGRPPAIPLETRPCMFGRWRAATCES